MLHVFLIAIPIDTRSHACSALFVGIITRTVLRIIFTDYQNLYSQLSANCHDSEACKLLMVAIKSLGTMVSLVKACSLYDPG